MSFPANSSLTKSAADAAEEIAKTAILARLQKEAAPTLLGTVADFIEKNPAPFVGAGIGAGIGGLASLGDEETSKYWPVNVLGGATIGAGTGLLRQVLQRQNTRNEDLKLKALSDSAKTRMDVSRPPRSQRPLLRSYRQFPVSTQQDRDKLIEQLLDDLIKLRQDPMHKGSSVDWKQYVKPVVDFVQKNPAPFIGAGVGAGVGGLASLTSEQRRKHMLSNMLSGGLAGGGIGLGAHLLMNNGDIAKQLVPKQKAPAQGAPAPAQGTTKPELPGSQTGPRSTPWSPSNSSPEAAKKDLEWAEGHLDSAGQQHEGWGGSAVRAGTGVGAAGIEANVAARHLNPLGREQSAAQDIWRRLNAGGEEAKSLNQVGKRLAQQNLSPAEIVDQIRGVKAQQPWSLKRLWGNASVSPARPAPRPNTGLEALFPQARQTPPPGPGGAAGSTIPREALEQLAREGRKLRPVRGLGLRGRLGVYGGFAGLSYWLDALARQRARELAAERLNILNQMSSGTTP